MATSVPVPTFTATGFVAPAPSAVLTGVQADISAAFGTSLNFNLNTPQGQLSSSEAAVVNNCYGLFAYMTQQMDPAFASGRFQDGIGRIYFLERLPAQPTSIQVNCLGAQGVQIPLGALVVDPSGNLYACVQAGTIPALGTIALSFAALIPGPTPVPASVAVYQAIPGWDAATVASGVPGVNTETRAAFEQRRAASVAANSAGSLPAIRGTVLAVPGVIDAYVTSNDTNTPVVVGGVTLGANSLYVCVSGGAAQAVGQAIWTKKMPGCGYTGTTTVTVQDSNSGYSQPFPSYQVSFTIAQPLAVLFAVNIVQSTLVPANAATLIQNALISAFGGGDGGPVARIGSVLLASRYFAPIQALGTWAQVRSLTIGSNNTPGAVFSGKISGTTLTVNAVTSGAIATGQILSDGNNYTAVGTTVTAGGGASWTVSQSQTVAGATFTGTGSGTSLTASAVTGTIQVGNLVTGTGVPANTTIVSQTSGTVGGAGVYVTSNATTSSGAAISCWQIFTAAAANLGVVTVQINQEPTLVAADIAVTVT